MSGMDTALFFNEVARISRASKDAAIRLVLLRGEAMSVPKWLSRLRVLTGTAWISVDGRDMIVTEGQSVELPGLKKPANGSTTRAPKAHITIPSLRRTPEGRTTAVVSAVCCPAVVFEMR